MLAGDSVQWNQAGEVENQPQPAQTESHINMTGTWRHEI
jgi:hypothetical protein